MTGRGMGSAAILWVACSTATVAGAQPAAPSACSPFIENHADGTVALSLAKVDASDPRALKAFTRCVRSLPPPYLEIAATEKDPSDLKATTEPKAYVDRALKWTAKDKGVVRQGIAETAGLRIDVCWVEETPQTRSARNLVREAVRATWETYGNIEFAGWQKCQGESRGISIAFRDAESDSKIGNESAGFTPSMYLNATFENDRIECKAKINQCVWSTAVHEFGHALYFLHEHMRAEVRRHPDCKSKLVQGALNERPAWFAVPDTLGTEYDPVSVMNYCANIYERQILLSNCDVVALHQAYGRPVSESYRFEPKCKIEMRKPPAPK